MRKFFFTFLCTLFFTTSGCGKQKENDDCADTSELEWAVRLKLKPKEDGSYLATEDPEMKALIMKHDVTLWQAFHNTTNQEILNYYNLTRKNSMSTKNWGNAIKEFLSTGKFEDEIYEYGIAYIL